MYVQFALTLMSPDPHPYVTRPCPRKCAVPCHIQILLFSRFLKCGHYFGNYPVHSWDSGEAMMGVKVRGDEGMVRAGGPQSLDIWQVPTDTTITITKHISPQLLG